MPTANLILGITEAFKADSFDKKNNLGTITDGTVLVLK